MPYKLPLQGSVGGNRTLVMLEDISVGRRSYSLFFDILQQQGHQVMYGQIDADDLLLKSYGEYLYDNIVLFASSDAFNSITLGDISDFINDGGNLVFATSEAISDNLRLFGETLGIEFDDKKSMMIDHFSFESNVNGGIGSSGCNGYWQTNVLCTNVVDSPVVLGDFYGKKGKTPILYRGIGHAIEEDSIFAVKLLKGNPSSYSTDPCSKDVGNYPQGTGEESALVTTVQARNNARILVSGSMELFSNNFFKTVSTATSKVVGNEIFCSEIVKWVFGKRGVLRFRDIKHNKIDGTPPDVILHEKDRPDLPKSLYPDPEITRNSLVYRIKDEIIYSMVVEEFDTDSWRPFVSHDMQLEFVMLDPYVRKTMVFDSNERRYIGKIVAPDDYGVFKFRVLYRRQGYSVLHSETQVSIRPFKHDEYERFIPTAFPYYSACFSMMIAFFLFSMFYLFSA